MTTEKILKELKSVLLAWIYFLIWFAALMLIKVLLLEEYNIKFSGVSVVIIGSLVASKAVVILQNVSFGGKNQPAIVHIFLRTLLYLAGTAILMLLEHAFETRHEFGGFWNAIKNLGKSASFYHVIVNVICVFGALFFYNFGSVIKTKLGKGGLMELLISPIEK
ncbi:hypothetical protein [Namhaeicola litoreus]|uniref:Uncharacterized protein n=1 Tax=Namhaeicola litoreus TaxID=1052145 RepID=A0ABW3Y119_9FLAO